MKWMRSPLFWFYAILTLLTIRQCVHPGWSSVGLRRLEYLQRIALGFLAAWFVTTDTRRREEAWPADHMMVMALVLFPAYLLTTRKWKGLCILAGLILSLVVAAIIPSFFV